MDKMSKKGIYAILYDNKGNVIENVAIGITEETLEQYHTCDSVNKTIHDAIAKYGKTKWENFDSYEIKMEE